MTTRLFVFALFLNACVTTPPVDLPDVPIRIDAGERDGGVDTNIRPTVDPCVDPGSTVGESCTDSADCQDLCFCNGEEVCMGGTCQLGEDPCADTVACTNDACLEETDACFNMPNHASCSNDLACDGYERCDARMGCVASAPLYCNDEDACTVDSCDEEMGCVYVTRDLDGDGFVAGSCGGEDCDDDPRYGTMIYPGATEVCENRRDDDCNGRRDFDDDACLPTNDTCTTATMLALGPTGGTFSGSTEGLRTDYSIACATGVSSGDAVFRFSLAAPRDVRISTLGTPRAAIALRPFASCSAGPDIRCNSGPSASVFQRSVPAGDYAILVRTQTGESFDLRIELTDATAIPPVDICDGSTTDVSAGGTFRGRFEEVDDDYPLGCHPGVFPEAAYRFTIPDDGMLRDVQITGSTSGAPFGSTTFLQLTTSCASAPATLRCTTGTTASIRQRGLGPGTYYILLESSALDATEWSLTVTIGPAAARNPGDACTSAIDITPTLDGTGAGSRSASVALGTLEGDGGVSCGTSAPDARDAYFALRLATTADVTFRSSAAATFHYTALQSTCGVAGSERRCRSGVSPLAQVFRGLPAGTHYFVVQSTATFGNIDVTAEVRPATPIPMNDTCPGITLDLSAPVGRTDTLLGFEDDLVGGTCSGTGRPDAFYTFTLTAARRVIISAATLSGSAQLYVTLRNGCAGSTALFCASGAGSASINQMLSPGTYTIQVEQALADASDFSLSVF